VKALNLPTQFEAAYEVVMIRSWAHWGYGVPHWLGLAAFDPVC
jgi:hypothetical protein